MKPPTPPTGPMPCIDPKAPTFTAWNDPVAEALVSVLANVALPLAMLSPTMMGALPVMEPDESLLAYCRVLVTTCVPSRLKVPPTSETPPVMPNDTWLEVP